MTVGLQKTLGSPVEGKKFFDREHDLEVLTERVREGNHTLLVGQRRMGKTSVVRELLRRLRRTGDFETVFVDFEAARSPAETVVELATASKPIRGVWGRVKDAFANAAATAGGQIDEVGLSELRVKLRSDVDRGNWRTKGDAVLAAFADHEKPVVLAIDELPIFVNRLLVGEAHKMTHKGKRRTDEYLSWLRKNVQRHQDSTRLIVSGSIGLMPIVRQAGLAAQVNVFSPFELKPSDEPTATDCLDQLAANYGLDLSCEVRREMCRRLRCCVPHHVQVFFDKIHEYLRRSNATTATIDDVREVFEDEMISIHANPALDHYLVRLKTVLGDEQYGLARELLTEAAVADGRLEDTALKEHCRHWLSVPSRSETDVEQVLHVLEHDGYLASADNGYRFASGWLEAWWRTRHARQSTHPRDRSGPA